MNIYEGKRILERAKNSIAHSQDFTNKESIQLKIDEIESLICLQEGVSSMDMISATAVCDHSLSNDLVRFVVLLEESI